MAHFRNVLNVSKFTQAIAQPIGIAFSIYQDPSRQKSLGWIGSKWKAD